tara:strand:- start:3755 stop:3952 length:198 start_codon:yes stop_codon:yes gene_type:complete
MDFRHANPFIDAIPQTGTIEVSYMVYEFALSLIEAARELGYSSDYLDLIFHGNASRLINEAWDTY